MQVKDIEYNLKLYKTLSFKIDNLYYVVSSAVGGKWVFEIVDDGKVIKGKEYEDSDSLLNDTTFLGYAIKDVEDLRFC